MPLTPSLTRAVLAELGHRPNRKLGQNFLVDGNIVLKSLQLAGVAAGDCVVEIGPGLGTLTGALLDAGAEVWAVEFDPRLHSHLVATLVPRANGRLHLLHGDAVEHPCAARPADSRPFKIVANLPYSISTPWLDRVLGGPLPERMVLMLQQEAAQRYVAAEGSKIFGAISILVQSAYAVEPGHKVPAACFHPRPDIESVLLNLGRRPAPFVFPPAVKSLIRACFQQRRKQLGSILRDKLPAGAAAAWFARLTAAGFGPQSRAEQVPVALWRELTV